ncbi:hypothetical protein [Lactobacillus allii] [Lactiplantibacillus mudanjiangensis]|uniref:HTH tetR-type domain-containing protein n=2 Tax=Lactiplantibacillus mudanjiangensis TaxID=1296538 RepID=A0A660ECW4_9LACO|nr:hypothetical protein [Lactobacillus allii] [Lactiplantibacillus mudanjiangensis]VDG25399.1 hypothetical protein [Lactobacillus allii] [Lactiplantibacillus mudanjiangensis]VDG30421.1 hypothetical protein [Lactobacillus allii] [Lactiplantibacillus mudanjiangensis]VDG30797.1 hypothetical protein [Lactobacillus allii] [Lactiplantibacillus mudanjiangensis]
MKMVKRAEAVAATRQKILTNADRLLAEKGYQAMSIVDITKASGIAKGTFYNYFETKEDLLLALSKKHLKPLMTSIPDLAVADPQTSIQTYLVHYLQVVVDSGEQMARQWIRFVVDPKNHQKWEFDLDALAELIQQLVTMGKLTVNTPVKNLSTLLVTQIYGIVFSWCISPATVDPIVSVNSFCDLQLAAILQPYQVD